MVICIEEFPQILPVSIRIVGTSLTIFIPIPKQFQLLGLTSMLFYTTGNLKGIPADAP